MTQPPVAIFRFDASPSIGGGHAGRCLALADALRCAGWACRIATGKETPAINAQGHEIAILEADARAEDQSPAMREQWPGGCDLLVVDHYGMDAAFETGCAGWAKKILVIDDLQNRAHDADFVLDPNPGRCQEDRKNEFAGRRFSFMGPGYALLAPAFAKARPLALARRRDNSEIRNILVSVGAGDPGGVTRRIINGLARVATRPEITIVLGAGSTSSADVVSNSLQELEGRGTLEIGINAERMAQLMTEADLCIGAGGVSALERCCLALPSIIIPMAENQIHGSRALAVLGAGRLLGKDLPIATDDIANRITEAVDGIASSPEDQRAMAINAARVCDGVGAGRITAAMTPDATASDGQPAHLRMATPDDAEIMLDWQRHANTRRFARDSNPPERGVHIAWVNNRLADGDTILNIIMHGDAPAGVLRLDRRENAREVSVLVAPDKYRLGLGLIALRQAEQLVPDTRLLAFIKPENKASLSLFERAGYVATGDDWFDRTPKLVAALAS